MCPALSGIKMPGRIKCWSDPVVGSKKFYYRFCGHGLVGMAGEGYCKISSQRIIDGKNLVPLLLEEVRHSEHEFIFHYCGSYLHAVRWYQKESGALWKVHYVTPNFQPQEAGACFGIKMCQYFSNEVTHHNPLLFDLSRDLLETNPLSPASEPLFNMVISQMAATVAKHYNTLTPVTQQLDVYNTVWKPWLHPCCGTFPFCWCEDESNNDTIIK
uniref:Uncharacterized protein n=1 Tax=Laticauda laticaudata TaxID=8630 RepID=A0A8C5RCA1_LATLA